MQVVLYGFLPLGICATALRLSLFERQRNAIAAVLFLGALPVLCTPWAVQWSYPRLAAWLNDDATRNVLCTGVAAEALLGLLVAMETARSHYTHGHATLRARVALIPSLSFAAGLLTALVVLLNRVQTESLYMPAILLAVTTAGGLLALRALLLRVAAAWVGRLELLLAVLAAHLLLAMVAPVLLAQEATAPTPIATDWRAHGALLLVAAGGIGAGLLRARWNRQKEDKE